MDSSSTPIMTVAIILLVCMSAYFSATETAFSSLNRIRLKSWAEDGNQRAALALQLSEDYDRLLSTILIVAGNLIAGQLIGPYRRHGGFDGGSADFRRGLPQVHCQGEP